MKTALAIVVGVVVGICISMLAEVFSGVGHGWGSAFISSVSIVGAPLAMAAWVQRRRRAGFLLALGALLGALTFDALLWRETVSEGTQYVARVWEAAWPWVLLWAVLFLAWQLLAVIVIFGRFYR